MEIFMRRGLRKLRCHIQRIFICNCRLNKKALRCRKSFDEVKRLIDCGKCKKQRDKVIKRIDISVYNCIYQDHDFGFVTVFTICKTVAKPEFTRDYGTQLKKLKKIKKVLALFRNMIYNNKRVTDK